MNARKSRAIRAAARQLTTKYEPQKPTHTQTPKGLKFSGMRWPEGTFRWVLKKLKRVYQK